MAVIADVSVGMSFNEQLRVHPFFDKGKRSVNSILPRTQLSITSEGSSEPVDDGNFLDTKSLSNQQLQNQVSYDQGRVSRLEDKRPPSSSVIVNSYTVSDHHVLSPQQNSESDANRHVDIGEVATLDVDLNSARNKRRRISASGPDSSASEPQSDAWLAQLQAAAYGKRTESPLSPPGLNVGLVIEPPHPADIPIRTSALLDSNQTDEICPALPLPCPEVTNSAMPPLRPSTPKKKMLKLGPNGKLLSPKSRSNSSTDKKNLSKPTTSEPRKVAIIKYGSDGESRCVLGQKIEAISGGTGERQSSRTPMSTETLQSIKAASSKPAKPIHPFFGDARAKRAISPKKLSESLKINHSHTASEAEDLQSIKAKASGFTSESDLKEKHISGLTGPSKITMGRGVTGSSKSLGVTEAVWPCRDMMHIRGLDHAKFIEAPPLHYTQRSQTQIKMKGSIVSIPHGEDVLSLLDSKVPDEAQQDGVNISSGSRDGKRILRVPQRELLTGIQLQTLVREELYSKPAISNALTEVGFGIDIHSLAQHTGSRVHPAAWRVYEEIPRTLTAFDQARCDPYSWLQKYAPKRAEEVLQPGREAIILRDWLRSLTIERIDTVSPEARTSRESSVLSKRPIQGRGDLQTARRKKRRKRTELLDDFVISSDEEEVEMGELTEDETQDVLRSNDLMRKRTVVRGNGAPEDSKTSTVGSALSNAILISGPHGCGKTAAAYAVAGELGFEVFELNPGGRRSGKDIMDRVGDMTRNHLVQHISEGVGGRKEDDSDTADNALRADLATGRQVRMNSFFKSTIVGKSSSPPKKGKPKIERATDHKSKQYAKPKQSLILLEEVDILFDEDKQFWITVLGLIAQSKRPVIMTCNDENLIPMEHIFLHAILRFAPPADDLATDYLLLLAANEGHRLHRSAVLGLYQIKGKDLRASIVELDFWCQMGVGDKKGGLEWLPELSPSTEIPDGRSQRLRIVSEGTYLRGMGWLNGDRHLSEELVSRASEDELLSEAWHSWEFDLEDWCEYRDLWTAKKTLAEKDCRKEYLADLQRRDSFLDAISASDLYCSPGLRTGDQAPLDNTQPDIPEKTRSNFIEGYPLLQRDLVIEHSGLSTSIALTARSLARHCFSMHADPIPIANVKEEHIIESLTFSKRERALGQNLTRAEISAAFKPLTVPPNTSFTSLTGSLLSEFDRSTSLIVEDLAPYVRSIIFYDLYLEKERLRLSSLLSEGGRDGKRIRTTRASRAALEGGSKAHTRRERWLPAGTNANSALRTGGQDWQHLAAQSGLEAH